jgi:hypothetical protein
MSDLKLPEATLIDVKRITKLGQNIISAESNYSELFDKEENRNPKPKHSFSFGWGLCASYFSLTSNMKFRITGKNFICIGNEYGFESITEINNSDAALYIRPVFKYSEIKNMSKEVKELAPGYLLITFGEYPNESNESVKEVYKGLKPTLTGNKYTLVDIICHKKELTEYKEVTFDGDEGRFVVKDGDIYEVEPVYFLVDIKKDFAISRDIMFRLPTLVDARKVSSYKETLPYEFLNTYFVPELMQGINKRIESEYIASDENPLTKDLLDNILQLITNSCLESLVKAELQDLIDTYNNDLENEKAENENIRLSLLDYKNPDDKFIEKLQSLLSKIKSFPYFEDSRIVFSYLNFGKLPETNLKLYKDIDTIINYILPTLPEKLREAYQTKIYEILNYIQNLISELYQNQSTEINIELKVRAMLHPILESLLKDVNTNYIDINLNEIVNGYFKASNDKCLASLFGIINETLREIEMLIANGNSKYQSELKELLNIENGNKSFDYLKNLYISLVKLKLKIENEGKRKEKLERKKIRRKIFLN